MTTPPGGEACIPSSFLLRSLATPPAMLTSEFLSRRTDPRDYRTALALEGLFLVIHHSDP